MPTNLYFIEDKLKSSLISQMGNYENGANSDRQYLAVIQVKKLQTEMLKLSQNLAL